MRKARRAADSPVAPYAWPQIHAAWMEVVNREADLGNDQPRISLYATELVETLFVRPGAIGGALTRFGQRLGGEGWPLDQVSRWIDLLAQVCTDPPANYLRSFGSGVSLANGWTEGSLRGMRAEKCFDAVTGLCTMAVLRLRLQQVFEQSTSLGVEPNWLYRLIIVDADIAEFTSLEADAVMVVLAELLQQRFTAGETVSRERGRIFVLVANDENLDARVSEMLADTRSRSLLHAARILGWVEDLPAASTQIDQYMSDLSV